MNIKNKNLERENQSQQPEIIESDQTEPEIPDEKQDILTTELEADYGCDVEMENLSDGNSEITVRLEEYACILFL